MMHTQSRKKTWLGVVAVLVVILGLAAGSLTAQAVKPTPPPPPPNGDPFLDEFSSFDDVLWAKADGWANGPPFDNGWQADHVTFGGGNMTITLDDTSCSGEPYCSGELRTTGFYGYGCYEARFQPAAVSGVVSTFFTFAGPYDTPDWKFPQQSQHNEIDIEFLGYNTNQVQFNFWTNDDLYSSHNEYVYSLGFDASQAMHNYGFKWTSEGIEWYVDGVMIYSVSDLPQNPTPKTTDTTQKIMLNVWPVDETASGWAGVFTYPGSPIEVDYDWASFTPGEDCSMGDPPPTATPGPSPTPGPTDTPAPTSTPGGNGMHVDSIVMTVVSRGTQATAAVTVVDGSGAPVEDAAVLGQWSGLVTTGDGERDTDAQGVALFYSGRSRETGTFTFCVTGIVKDGMTYDPGSNVETCDSIDN